MEFQQGALLLVVVDYFAETSVDRVETVKRHFSVFALDVSSTATMLPFDSLSISA